MHATGHQRPESHRMQITAYRKSDQLRRCVNSIRNDNISIEVIAQQDIDATADLLATAFSEAIDRENYKRFLEKEIQQYLRVSTTELSEDCVIFVAKASESGDSDSKTIVGTGMVSFNTKSRSKFLTCNPPASALFLSNMAVSRDYQRQGIASLLLEECENHCRKYRQETMMCLQVRWKDTPATQLYRKFNYRTIKSDWPIVKVFKEPQDLLAKDLTASVSGTEANL